MVKPPSEEHSSVFTQTIEQSSINEDETEYMNQEDAMSQEIKPSQEEESDDEKQVKKWQVYFDPSQIIIQKELNEFINDAEVNNYRYLQYSPKIIPSFFILAVFVEQMIYSIIAFVDISRYGDFVNIIFFVIRLVYMLLSLRFLIVFNTVNFIINFKVIKEKHRFFWQAYLASIAISIAILLAVGIGMIIVFCVFKPFELNEFHYSPVYENVSISNQASVCQIQFFDFDLIEYAGIASLGQSQDEKMASEILSMVFNRTFPITSIVTPISYMFTFQYNESLYIRTFESLTNKTSISFMLDLYLNDFVINKMSYGTIPFYHIAMEVFLYRFLYFFSALLNRYLFINLIHNFAYFANNLYEFYDKIYFENSTIIYVGHSIGGLIAKAIGSKRNVPSVAFETLEYYRSLFHMSINMGSSFDFSSERLKIMNVFSPSQIFSQTEKTSAVNVYLPKWKDIYQFTNSYETFCIIAAGCATDARYDQFCNAVVGRNNYLNLFKLWNRTRSDNNE